MGARCFLGSIRRLDFVAELRWTSDSDRTFRPGILLRALVEFVKTWTANVVAVYAHVNHNLLGG